MLWQQITARFTLGKKSRQERRILQPVQTAPGVEERMRILFSEGVMKGRITLPQMVHYLCTNPSRMYGLYPQKGTLLPGSDADLILLNPEKERILTCGYAQCSRLYLL